MSSRMSFSTSVARIAQAHADAEAKDELSRLMAFAGPRKAPARRAAPRPEFDVWIEAHFSEFKSDPGAGLNSKGHFGVVYVGADYLITPSILVGALVQFDKMSERARFTNAAAEGWGAMAGPYLSMRLTPNLFFDARAAWGSSSNTVDPFGFYQDDFSTNRWLGQAKLTGNWRFGDFRVTPSAGVTYVTERQRSYIDALGVLIPGQTVSLGQFAVGPELAYRYLAASGTTYEPHVSLEGIWDFDRPNAPTVGGVRVSDKELHARVKGGVLARSPNGVNVRAVASYDGIGSTFRAVGGQLWLSMPLR
jgi:outer membrane autotransporter protein